MPKRAAKPGKEPSLTEKLQVRMTPAQLGEIERFCKLTERDVPETVRAIVRIFLADGFDRASARLNRGLYDAMADEIAPLAREIAEAAREELSRRVAGQAERARGAPQ